MPNYDYQCLQCGHREEILQKITEEPVTVCPQCQQTNFKRKFGKGIGLQFQGSGFYCNDYNANKVSSSQEKAAEPTAQGCGCGKTSCSA